MARSGAALAVLALLLAILAPRPAVSSVLSDTGFFCDLDQTQSCDLVDSWTSPVNALLATDGFLFVLLNDGRLLRCIPEQRSSCVGFNNLMNGGGKIAVLGPGQIVYTSGANMAICNTTAAPFSACTVIHSSDYYWSSLLVADGRIYAGSELTNLIVCETTPPYPCTEVALPYDSRSSGVSQGHYYHGMPLGLAYTNGTLYVGLSTGLLLRCQGMDCKVWQDPSPDPPRTNYNSGYLSTMLLVDGALYLGLGSGIMLRCPLSRPDGCERFTALDTTIYTMIQAPTSEPQVYVSTVTGVYACSTSVPESCTALAASKKGAVSRTSLVVAPTGPVLYASYTVTTRIPAYPYDKYSFFSSVAWAVLDDCTDRSVVAILDAAPVFPDGVIPVDLKASSERAVFSGTALNYQAQQQTINYGITVMRTTQVTVNWAEADRSGWKVDVKTPLSIILPEKSEISAGFSSDVTITNGKSGTTTNSVTNAATIQNVVPAHSNCSVQGTVTTSTASWSQQYDVVVQYKCGRNGTVRWTANLAITEVLTTSSQYLTEWLPCSILPMPPITATCSSNPGCAFIGTGNCCPRDDGTYLSCCAQAAANSPQPCQPGKDFLFPNQTICPNRDWVYKPCCPPVTYPTSVVSGVRFERAQLPGMRAACGPGAYDAGMPIGAAGLRMCVETAAAVGDRVSAADGGRFVANITVVAGRRPFAELACPAGFSKHETNINAGAPSVADSSSVALCIRRARAGTPVARLAKSMLLHPTCKFAHGSFARLRGNLNGAASDRRPPAFLCVSTES